MDDEILAIITEFEHHIYALPLLSSSAHTRKALQQKLAALNHHISGEAFPKTPAFLISDPAFPPRSIPTPSLFPHPRVPLLTTEPDPLVLRSRVVLALVRDKPVLPLAFVDLITTWPSLFTSGTLEDLALVRLFTGYEFPGIETLTPLLPPFQPHEHINFNRLCLGVQVPKQSHIAFTLGFKYQDRYRILSSRNFIYHVLLKILIIKLAPKWKRSPNAVDSFRENLFLDCNLDPFRNLTPRDQTRPFSLLTAQYSVFSLSFQLLVKSAFQLLDMYNAFGTAVLIDPFWDPSFPRTDLFTRLVDHLIVFQQAQPPTDRFLCVRNNTDQLLRHTMLLLGGQQALDVLDEFLSQSFV